MDLRLAGDVALVTASSQGLGLAAAKSLARQGVDVVLNGRNEARLERAVAEVEAESSGEAYGVAGDLTKEVDIERMVESCISTYGRLDHLVTSAGGPPYLAPLEATGQDWSEAFELLVLGVVRTVHAAQPHLNENGGTVTAITSRAVKTTSPRNVLSSSVRMSVVGFTKTLSKTLSPTIRTNAILPGPHATPRVMEPLAEQVEQGVFSDMEAAVEQRIGDNPSERLGDPQEFGDLVAFLSSPRAGYLNGQAIVVDGGAIDSVF